jgi:hypothetical protein
MTPRAEGVYGLPTHSLLPNNPLPILASRAGIPRALGYFHKSNIGQSRLLYQRGSPKAYFKRLLDLQSRGEHIDRVTVAEELALNDELGFDGLSYLTSLDEGLPQIAHLDSYVNILRKKSTLRRAIFAAHNFAGECQLEAASPAELLSSLVNCCEPPPQDLSRRIANFGRARR